MKVDINKTYRTKDGHPVVIYAIYEGQNYAVHGAYQNEGEWIADMWKLDGNFYGATEPSEYDLVEVRPERVVWINEYGGGTGAVNTTKEEADKYCSPYRIALHRVVLNEDTVYKGDD